MPKETVAPRAAQLAELAGLLRSERGGLALITGAAGIGKTWLAAETDPDGTGAGHRCGVVGVLGR